MENKHLVYGKHSAISVLKNKNRQINKILCTNSSLAFLKQNIPNFDIKKADIVESQVITKTLYSNGYKNALHQDVVVFTRQLIQPDINDIILTSKFLVLLDELQDSQNIGAIIRSAALFNVDALISTLHNSPDENSHIIKAASGAFEYIPFIKTVNLSQTINILKKNNYWTVGMSCDANQSLDTISKNFSKDEKIAIIVGNEEKGMRKMVEKNCDFLVTIPVNQSRGVDSLNASNATAIFLYEISKIFA
jgi:23S rRNA (guanosine2251-2'-O)-methyltransferase